MKCEKIEIIRNRTKAFEVIFRIDGQTKNITGWTVYFTVKEFMKDIDSNAKIKKVITSHPSPLNGISLIELSSSDTNISAGSYYFSIDYKDDSNNIGTITSGRLRIIEPVLDNPS